MIDLLNGVSRETRMREAAELLSAHMQGSTPQAFSWDAKGIERKPPEEDPDGSRRRALGRCQRACDGDEQQRAKYCRRLPDRRLKALCRGYIAASKFACRGWCYNEFGD